MQKPYYQDSAVTIYHGDCREIVPQLGRFDLLLTDPPYGIGCDKGVGQGGKGLCSRQYAKQYEGGWDKYRPEKEVFDLIIGKCDLAIVWGGNYFNDVLPHSKKWLVLDKQNTMPSYSDVEIAWTNFSGQSTKMFRYNCNGMLGSEPVKYHPTQKPYALISWCIILAGDAQTILDPFAGSGTTGRAAKDLNKAAVLIEREERYCEIAADRMSQEVLAL
jgi:DNA modification methylase